MGGCGLFGEPLATDFQLPLTVLQPGFNLTDQYIKFRTRGSIWDPASLVWYRMPRSGTGAGKKLHQVGYRASSPENGGIVSTPTQSPVAATGSTPSRRFP